MREILFRGKRMDNGEWMFGDLRHWRSGNVGIHDEVTKRTIRVAPSTVGQYTGLKDKNGMRIFEGDICRNKRTNEIVSVCWHGTMAGYVWSKRRDDGSYLSDFGELFRAYDKYEIIGNIHDNPELLKEGKER